MTGSATVAQFVDDLAADPPGPAGGSALAVTVAMAAALAELAARRSGASDLAAGAAALRRRALPLSQADADAYALVLSSDGEARTNALARASDVLREIAAAAAETQRLASPLLDQANPALRADVRAALELADAARRSVEHLVRANASEPAGDAR